MPSNQKNTHFNFFIGCICSSLSAMLGGTTFVFTRALVTSLDPLVISFMRYGFTGLLFLIFFFISFKKIIFQKNDLIYMALIGIFMLYRFCLFNYLLACFCRMLFLSRYLSPWMLPGSINLSCQVDLARAAQH